MSTTVDVVEVEQLAGQVFDRYSEAIPFVENARDLECCRAIGAAGVIGFIKHERWYDILDLEMAQRGKPTHFSELDLRVQRQKWLIAAYEVGELTKSSRSIPDMLRMLSR